MYIGLNIIFKFYIIFASLGSTQTLVVAKKFAMKIERKKQIKKDKKGPFMQDY